MNERVILGPLSLDNRFPYGVYFNKSLLVKEGYPYVNLHRVRVFFKKTIL